MNQFYKNLALWLVIGMILIALFNIFNQPQNTKFEVIFSEFMNQVETGQVTEVTIQGDNISGKYADGRSFQTMAPPKDPDLVRTLREKGVRIVVVPPEQTSWYMNILISWFPMILLLGIWIFFMRQMQSGGDKALSFGKSKARLM
ncbi:MAG TPA: ATP-dependent metallopeptidase FtsH/Yme1/Tma family protein, partial [Nitrospinaceae bacterium]|nr:ATP-dependent metallopeptidase FtsH/Yme1/Tma family protein [Nitrospinaceae bacterium]